MSENRLYKYMWLLRELGRDELSYAIGIAICPKCKCKLQEETIGWASRIDSYKYYCLNCDFVQNFKESIHDNWRKFLIVRKAEEYKDVEIVNLDWDLVRIQREWIKDEDYRIDAKITKNKKDQLQLMVMAWSKNTKDKVQLFLDPTNEKLSFDQNDSHPKEIFAKVTATFKDSKTSMTENIENDSDDK